MGFPKMLDRQNTACSVPSGDWCTVCHCCLQRQWWRMGPGLPTEAPTLLVAPWICKHLEHCGASFQLAGTHPWKGSPHKDWLEAMFTLNSNFLTDGNSFHLLWFLWSQQMILTMLLGSLYDCCGFMNGEISQSSKFPEATLNKKSSPTGSQTPLMFSD